MGCLASKEDAEFAYNRDIDAAQHKQMKTLDKHNELLILGTGISGKTSK
jgi:hypothetical protein